MIKQNLIKALEAYNGINDRENEMVGSTLTFLKNNDVFLGKGNPAGHITGSAWIVNKGFDQCLLTHHGKLDIWVQTGGHTEVDETVFESSFREAVEESGLNNLSAYSEDIYDVDVHLIPDGKEPAHYHYDIRYLFVTDMDEPVISEESHDVKWVHIDEIENYTKDPSVLRMVEKMEAIVGRQIK